MTKPYVLPLLLLAGVLAGVLYGVDVRADIDDEQAKIAAQQAELDRDCEEARALALAPIRDDIYDECIEGEKGDEQHCRRYADGYNGNRIGGAPRFYELPECEQAFEFRNQQRK